MESVAELGPFPSAPFVLTLPRLPVQAGCGGCKWGGSFTGCLWAPEHVSTAPQSCLHHNNVSSSPLVSYCPFYDLGGQHIQEGVTNICPSSVHCHFPVPRGCSAWLSYGSSPSVSEFWLFRPRPCTTCLLQWHLAAYLAAVSSPTHIQARASSSFAFSLRDHTPPASLGPPSCKPLGHS